MNLRHFFFEFEGRLSRKGFWLGFMFFLAVEYATILGLSLHYFAFDGAVLTSLGSAEEFAIIALLVGWLLPALFLPVWVKRWHDLNKPWQMALTILVPGIGHFILLVCGLLPGTKGPNSFGPDPTAN